MPTDETAEVRLAADVPVAFAEQFRRLAEHNGRSVASEMRMALRAWVVEAADKEPGS